MQVYVNDRKCDFPLQPDTTLAEVLQALEVELEPGHIVTEISVDDKRYHAAESDRLARRRVESVGELTVHTQSPGEFAATKRLEIGRSLSLVAEKAGQAAMLFRKGDVHGANSLFATLMEELRLILLLDQHLAALTPGEGGGALAAAEMEEVARGLLEAQEKKAWRSVASLLEGSLVPVLQNWARLRGGGLEQKQGRA